jgi:hypothetical protein
MWERAEIADSQQLEKIRSSWKEIAEAGCITGRCAGFEPEELESTAALKIKQLALIRSGHQMSSRQGCRECGEAERRE